MIKCGVRFRKTPRCDVTLESPLDEIGLDSLARMDVLNRLEETFSLRFTEDSLYDMVTCRDVIEYIEANASGERSSPAVGTATRRSRTA